MSRVDGVRSQMKSKRNYTVSCFFPDSLCNLSSIKIGVTQQLHIHETWVDAYLDKLG